MKKYLTILFAAAMTAALVISCAEKDDDGKQTLSPEDPASVQTEHLVAYFPFESDAKIMDFGAGMTASKSGACSFVKGVRGNAYSGASEGISYVGCDLGATNPFKSMSSFTFAMWLNAAHKYPGAPALLSFNAGGDFAGSMTLNFEEGTEGELKFKLVYYNTRTEWKQSDWVFQNYAFAPNKWLHFVLTYDENTSKFTAYANGKYVFDSGSRWGGPEVDGVQPPLGAYTFDPAMTKMSIGAWFNNLDGNHAETFRSSYPGLMDELRIYDVALTADEVMKLHTNEVLVSDGLN